MERERRTSVLGRVKELEQEVSDVKKLLHKMDKKLDAGLAK